VGAGIRKPLAPLKLPDNTFVEFHRRVVQDPDFDNSIGGGPETGYARGGGLSLRQSKETNISWKPQN
jgi:hypothetical protein